MSRYLLLWLVNMPFVALGLLGTATDFKLKKIGRRKLVTKVALWLSLVVGLALAEPIYTWLFIHGQTQTESLSLFDVVLFTGLIGTFFLLTRAQTKIEVEGRRLRDLHQELSILMSEQKNK